MDPIRNPYAPGAGQRPPELAGRDRELGQFEVTLERVGAGRPERSMVLSGLRGVGKTVLLNALRGEAVRRAWGTGKIEARPDQSIRIPVAQAVHAAAAGDALIAPSVTARLLAAFAGAPTRAAPVQPVDALTEREEEVLLTVARGRTNVEIADELCISLSTVKSHLASLMTKLHARNRVELAMWAYETARVPVT